jgi:hypothetical protein
MYNFTPQIYNEVHLFLQEDVQLNIDCMIE